MMNRQDWEQAHESLHAHLDCVGVSGDALLSACVDAVSDDDSMAKNLVKKIESCIKDTLGGLGDADSSFGLEYVLKISEVLIPVVKVGYSSGSGSDGST